jgi:RNA polymerase sigma-70 factor (ECF subfamily)
VSFLLAVIASVFESDGTLALRIAARDPAALRRLFDRTSGRVRALALRILRSAGEADDVVQDTFLEVWRAIGSYDDARGSLATWVTTIAHRRAVDRLRRRATRPLGDAAPADGVSDAPDPRETAADREERARVVRALSALGAEQRAAIELMYYGGLSQSEAAEQLGVALGTFKSRVRAGMGQLATLLGHGNAEAEAS